MEEELNETKKMNTHLVKIIEKLDERIARLEDRSG
jgi:hypothetical protein